MEIGKKGLRRGGKEGEKEEGMAGVRKRKRREWREIWSKH